MSKERVTNEMTYTTSTASVQFCSLSKKRKRHSQQNSETSVIPCPPVSALSEPNNFAYTPDSSPTSLSSTVDGHSSPLRVTESCSPPVSYSNFIRCLAAKYNREISSVTDKTFDALIMPVIKTKFTNNEIDIKPSIEEPNKISIENANLFRPCLGTNIEHTTTSTVSKSGFESYQSTDTYMAFKPYFNYHNSISMLNALALYRTNWQSDVVYPNLMPSNNVMSTTSQVRISETTTPPSTTYSGCKKFPQSCDENFSPMDLTKKSHKKSVERSSNNTTKIDQDKSGAVAKDCKECTDNRNNVASWSTQRTSSFVRSVQECSEYAAVFERHKIDGSCLTLLTIDHMTSVLKMKLGPAIKLSMALSRTLGLCSTCDHCTHCHLPRATQQTPNTPPAASPVTTLKSETQTVVSSPLTRQPL